MQRFQNILVYPASLHAGDPAIDTAANMARQTGAQLTLVWIVNPDGRWLDKRRRKRQARLNRLASRLSVEGVSARALVLVGKRPAELLAEQIRVRQVDLAIKSARPADAPGARAFSAIAKDLLRISTCPVWIVRGSSEVDSRVILAAVAPFHFRPELERMDRDVLDVASQLADIRHAKLHVVSAWEALGATVMRSSVSGDDYNDYMHSRELVARRSLHEFLTPYRVAHGGIHLRSDRAGRAIASVAEELGAELVVVGAAGRTGIRRWILGNTVDDVLDESGTAVLGVRGLQLPEAA